MRRRADSHPKRDSHNQVRAVLGLWLLLTLLPAWGCGAKKVEQNPPRRLSGADLPVPVQGTPRMRVLLAEDFSSLEVGGALSGQRVRLRFLGGHIELMPLEPAGPAVQGSGFRLEPARFQHLVWQERAYRGVFEVFINPLGQPVLVNEVGIEDYLRGVVPNELGPSRERLEAVKAQAVAARTFAITNRGRFNHLGFDLYADSRSQAYSGISGEEALATQAVLETAGRIAVFQDRPILAMYSSTCGGVTANYQSIFLASPLQYLQGGVRCRDRSSPYHEWEETVDLADRSASLERYAPGIGKVRRVIPGAKDSTGRLVELTLEGEEGSATLRGINLRLALGLRSNWILDLRPRGQGDKALSGLTVRGKGWGHGVGLCQYGAVEMAASGSSFREILTHYYPGTQVIDFYSQPR
ncbi:MAG TPA: SpoIID/LytB domain-containing protein [Acidobacteriota bacterium]|nr:SpoIID/LytB domain-containing protein [Acidobacteriota bacterium]